MAEIRVGGTVDLYPLKPRKMQIESMPFIVARLCGCGRGHEVLRPSKDPSPKRRLK